MQYNNESYSHKNLWFIREIEDSIVWTGHVPTGSFNELSLAHVSDPACAALLENRLPRSLLFFPTSDLDLGSGITVAMLDTIPDKLFIYYQTSYRLWAIIDIGPFSPCEIFSCGNWLIMATHESSYITLLSMSPLGLNNAKQKAGHGIGEVPVIDARTLQALHLEYHGPTPDNSLRMAAWSTLLEGELTFLAWNQDSDDPAAWIGVSKNEQPINFCPVGLALTSGDLLRISNVVYYSGLGKVFAIGSSGDCLLTCDANRLRPNTTATVTECFNVHSRGDNHVGIQSLSGFTVYQIPFTKETIISYLFELPKTPKHKLSKQEIVWNMPFLVAVDHKSRLSISLSMRGDRIPLPLLGDFNIPTQWRDRTNLAMYPLPTAQHVTQGPEASLLFWSRTTPKAWLLNPHLERDHPSLRLPKNFDNVPNT